GLTWKRATGLASWTYAWVPRIVGATTIMSRATDDSGNVEQPTIGVSVSVAPAICPCTIWVPSETPAQSDATDTNAVELGVRFTADVNGIISGLRFYKGTGNTGTHI